jgi:hypothetical protein
MLTGAQYRDAIRRCGIRGAVSLVCILTGRVPDNSDYVSRVVLRCSATLFDVKLLMMSGLTTIGNFRNQSGIRRIGRRSSMGLALQMVLCPDGVRLTPSEIGD